MQKKALIVGVAIKDGTVLMRKKPKGSKPYKETWYLFGAEVKAGVDPKQALVHEIETKTGIKVAVKKLLGQDTETKVDHDGIEKEFTYIDVACEYVSGVIIVGHGIEMVKWVKIDDLKSYDIVPPSRALFEKLGYIKNDAPE